MMSATENMQRIEELPAKELQELFVFLTRKIVGAQVAGAKQWAGKKLSFEEACDVVFPEKQELLSALTN